LDLGSIFFIDNLPFLVVSVVLVPNNDLSSFFILTTMNIKASVALLNVAEVFSIVGEDLPPFRVSAPNLHVIAVTRALDVP
jgi:hypothetical protein